MKKKNNIIELSIAKWPEKELGEKFELILNNNNKVQTSLDVILYGKSWDGRLAFSFDRYVCDRAHIYNNKTGENEVVTFKILEFRMSDNFDFPNKIQKMTINLDYLEGWCGNSANRPSNIENKNMYYNLKNSDNVFKISMFNLERIKQNTPFGSKSNDLTTNKRDLTINTVLKIEFDKEIDFIKGKKILESLNVLYDLFINYKAYISRTIVNDNVNWITSDKLSETIKKIPVDSMLLYYVDIKEKFLFNIILDAWINNKKIREFAYNYNVCKFEDIPLPIKLITLVASIETYYCSIKHEDVLPELVKFVQPEKNKYGKLNTAVCIAFLISQIPQYLQNTLFGEKDDIVEYINMIKNSRVYYVHGKEDDYRFKDVYDLINPIRKLLCVIYYVVLKDLGIPEIIYNDKFINMANKISDSIII